MQAVRQAIADRQKPIYVSSPGSLAALSAATTVAEQEHAGLKPPRADLGGTRAPYKTKKRIEEERKKQERERKELFESLTPEERLAARVVHRGGFGTCVPGAWTG